MCNRLNRATNDIARRLLILNYKLGVWYVFAKQDIRSADTLHAAEVAETELDGLNTVVKDTLHFEP